MLQTKNTNLGTIKTFQPANNGLFVNVKDLMLGFVLCLIYFFGFVSIAYLPTNAIIKYAALLIVGLYVLFNIRVIKKKKYLPINITVALFALWVLVLAYINRGNIVDRNTFSAAIVGMGTIVLMLILLEIVAEKGKFRLLINLFYVITILTAIATDLFAFILPIAKQGIYLVGTKFGVSYLHLQAIVLLLFRAKMDGYSKIKTNILLAVYTVWGFLISLYVDCNTGMIATVLFYILYFSFRNRGRILANPIVIVITLIFFCSFFFWGNAILENEFVQNFITNILGRDLTMTGRMTIYEELFRAMEGHWLLGYGYGSSYEISLQTMGAPNAQNGLFKWIMEGGIIATALIIGIVFIAFSGKDKGGVKVLPAILMVYVYAIIASVEITISTQFFFWCFVICIFSIEKEGEVK